MRPFPSWLIVLALAGSAAAPLGAEQNATASAGERPQAEGLTLVGRVRQTYSPRLFTIDHRLANERQVLVLVPEGTPAPAAGMVVYARGVLRSLDEAQVGPRAWSALEPRSRTELAGRPVLIADSMGNAAESTSVSGQPLPMPARSAALREITVRPTGLASLIGELAGFDVRLPYARVVGLFDSQSFLIDSAMSHSLPRGERDRILVLVNAGALRVPAESLVASTVTVVGVARTILGVQASGDAQWPSRLDADTLKRLDVRAAVIATSVRTADGVELTDRPPTR
jgi:hypothetical protein